MTARFSNDILCIGGQVQVAQLNCFSGTEFFMGDILLQRVKDEPVQFHPIVVVLDWAGGAGP